MKTFNSYRTTDEDVLISEEKGEWGRLFKIWIILKITLKSISSKVDKIEEIQTNQKRIMDRIDKNTLLLNSVLTKLSNLKE